MPFDRLIKALDEYYSDKTEEVFAQIGPAEYKPKNIKFKEFISPSDVEYYYKNSTLVIAHCGMGSVLTAMKHCKPVILFPRRAEFGEHRNDHQLATAAWLKNIKGINVAFSESDLMSFLNCEEFDVSKEISEYANIDLLGYLKNEINDIKNN